MTRNDLLPVARSVAAVAAVALTTSPPAGTSGARGFAFRLRPLGTPRGRVGQNRRFAGHRARGPEVQRSEACTGRSLFRPSLAGAAWPLVIWTPGRGEDRSDELGDANALARNGVASLLVDPPAPEVVTCDATKDLAIFRGYVVGRRRAVDLALTLPNVDGKRIAAAGFSYGASVTAVLAGVDHRIRAFALKSGRAHHTGFMRLACPQLGEKKLDAYVEKLSAIDPIMWVPKARGPAFLIQDGTRDPFNPKADVLALYRAAHGPKELRLLQQTTP